MLIRVGTYEVSKHEPEALRDSQVFSNKEIKDKGEFIMSTKSSQDRSRKNKIEELVKVFSDPDFIEKLEKESVSTLLDFIGQEPESALESLDFDILNELYEQFVTK